MTDETLYFACGWAIRPHMDYDRLDDFVDQFGIELAAVPPLDRSEQGYVYMTLAACVPDEPTMVEFIKLVGIEFGMTHWYRVPQEYYERGNPLRISMLPPDVRESWTESMNTYGEYNASLTAQYAEEDTEVRIGGRKRKDR
jgi:hypothetical protein